MLAQIEFRPLLIFQNYPETPHLFRVPPHGAEWRKQSSCPAQIVLMVIGLSCLSVFFVYGGIEESRKEDDIHERSEYTISNSWFPCQETEEEDSTNIVETKGPNIEKEMA